MANPILINQIIMSLGLTGQEAETKRQELSKLTNDELAKLLGNIGNYAPTDVGNFGFLNQTAIKFNGNVFSPKLNNDTELTSFSSSQKGTKKEYSSVQKKALGRFLGDFLVNSASAGLGEIQKYNDSVGWFNITDRVVNGFKVITGQKDRIDLEVDMQQALKDAQKFYNTALYSNIGAFEFQLEKKFGIPVSYANIEELQQTSGEFTRVTAYHEKTELLKQGYSEIKNIMRQEQEYAQAKKYVRGAAAASLTPPEVSSHEKFGEILLQLCNGDKNLLNEYMNNLSSQMGSRSEIEKNLPKIMEELIAKCETQEKEALGSKTYAQYKQEYETSCKKVFGTKGYKETAQNFVESAKTQAAYTEIGITIAASMLLPGSSLARKGIQKAAVKYGEKAAMNMMKLRMTTASAAMPSVLTTLNAATSKEGFTTERINEIIEKFKNGLMYGGFGAYVSSPLGLAVEKVLSKNPTMLSNIVSKTMGTATETTADVLFDRMTSDLSFVESLKQNGVMNFGMMIAGGQVNRALSKLTVIKTENGYIVKDKTGKEVFNAQDENALAGFVMAKGTENTAQSTKQQTKAKTATNTQQGVNISDYRVEKADDAALREIHKIDSEAFAETDPVAQRFEDYKADIEEQNLESYVIKDKNGKITGYFQLEPMNGDQLYINSIGVPKELRNTKSSFATLKQIQENIKDIALKNGAKTVALHVDASNKPLVKLYEKFGFKTVDTEQNYFANGDDALYMEADVAEHAGTPAKAQSAQTVSFKADGQSQPAEIATSSNLSDLKAGMESKAGEKLLEELGIQNINKGENSKYFDSIIHDLGEEFVDFINQRKDICTTKYIFISFMDKFANTANADMAKFIHDYKKGGGEFNEHELQALCQKPKMLKDISEFYRIAQETGLGDVIDANAVWKTLTAFSGYFEPGNADVIRKNLTALKQSAIKFDASNGMTVTLIAMGKLKDKSPEELLSLLTKINDATGGKTQNDKSLSSLIESARTQPETFDKVLEYGKLFGGELEDFKTFASAGGGLKFLVENGEADIINKMHDIGCTAEEAVSVVQQFGSHGDNTLKFSTSPEMLETLIILAKTPSETQKITGTLVAQYRSSFKVGDERIAKNLLDIVKLLDKELPGFKLPTPQQIYILRDCAYFITTGELKNIIPELKGYVENPSLKDLTNYVNLKRLKKDIETTISLLPRDKQEVMKYLCAPENILRHKEVINSNKIKDLKKIALGDPKIVKEMYILPDDVLKARRSQFSFNELSQIVYLKPEEYEVFKGLMAVDSKQFFNNDSGQFSANTLLEFTAQTNLSGAPQPAVIIDRVKELTMLKQIPEIKTPGLNTYEKTEFLALPENQYKRVKELYMAVNKPAVQIKMAAMLPDEKYAKFKSEYVDKIDEYKELEFDTALQAMQKSEKLFDVVTELAKTGLENSTLNKVITQVSIKDFNKTEFIDKLKRLNPNINIDVLGKNINIQHLEPERINDFLKTLLDSKKQLQHNDRAPLTDQSIYEMFNNTGIRFGRNKYREMIKLFSVLDDETLKASLSGKYDGVQHMLDLSNELVYYGVDKISVLKEKLAQLPLPQQRLDKFLAIMEVTRANSDDAMELVELIKSPAVTDAQKQTMQRIFASGKPYAEQIDDFIKEMNVPKSSENRVREFLQKRKFNERISIKTVDTKAQLAKIEKTIAATIANDKMPQDKKDARLAQLNTQKEELKNQQDGTTITMSPRALSDLTRMVEHHVNQVNNDIAFNRAITNKIYNKHNVNPSEELQDKINYDQKYTIKLLSANQEFSPEYRKLIELMDQDPNKPLSELRETIPENQQTRKLFEENGLDYEKWTKFDETFEKPFTLEIDARSALASVQRNAAAEFSSELFSNLAQKDKTFIESVIADVYKNKFKTEKPDGYTSDKGFLKPDGTTLNRQQHITLIQEVIDKIKENKEFGIEKQADGTAKLNGNVNEFLNHLESRIKDLTDAAQIKDMSEELYVRLSDDDDVGRNLFFGNHVHCCTSVQNFNGFAQPQHLMNTYVRGIEIVDKNGNSYGNSMCYFAKVDGKLTFIIDSFEANGKLGASKDVTDAIISTGKLICAEMGRPDAAVMLGPNYNKIDKSRFTETNGHIIEIIGRAPENTYIDCIGGRGDINIPSTERPMNEVTNLAPISNFRPNIKGVETLSQRDVWNINQNAHDIVASIHANTAESLQSIEQLFGLKKGTNPDGLILMYREKGEQGLIKKYFRKVLKSDELIRKYETGDFSPEEIAEGKAPKTPEGTARMIKSIQKERENLIKNKQTAMRRLGDSQGARIVMKNPTPEKIEQLTQQIIAGIEKGEITVIDFENYGKNIESTYFTKEQILRIKETNGGNNENINSMPIEKKSNYTTAQMILRLKNGTYIELQIRGEKIDELAEAEHILYKIREGEGGPAAVETAYNKVLADNDIRTSYEQYISKWFDFSRQSEIGIAAKPPELPEGIDRVLDMNYLMNLVRKGLVH